MLCAAAARKAGVPAGDVRAEDIRILRKSLDARNKNRIHWLYTLELFPTPLVLSGVAAVLPQRDMLLIQQGSRPRPIIIGTGPAGLLDRKSTRLNSSH